MAEPVGWLYSLFQQKWDFLCVLHYLHRLLDTATLTVLTLLAFWLKQSPESCPRSSLVWVVTILSVLSLVEEARISFLYFLEIRGRKGQEDSPWEMAQMIWGWMRSHFIIQHIVAATFSLIAMFSKDINTGDEPPRPLLWIMLAVAVLLGFQNLLNKSLLVSPEYGIFVLQVRLAHQPPLFSRARSPSE